MNLREQVQTLIGAGLVRLGLRLLGAPPGAKFAGYEVATSRKERAERQTDPAPAPVEDEDDDRAPFEVVREKSFAEPEQAAPLEGSLASRVRALRGE